ncbi:MAG: CHASE2 domain-containing protein (plasmid) [Leptolyngbya sp. BL-A-14]
MAVKATSLDKQQELDELLRFCSVKLTQEKFGWGSGFFVAPGYILTCAHVVKDVGEKTVTVYWQKTGNPYVSSDSTTIGDQVEFFEYQAKVEGLFPDPYDMALLKLTAAPPTHPCVYLDESTQPESSVRTGDELYTFGYPDKDYPNGAPVSASCENLTGDNPRQIKFKLGQIRPGFSGSPLLNHRTCKVCGIVKYTRDKSNDLGGGAIPSAAILAKFSELSTQQKHFHQKNPNWRNLLPSTRCSIRRVVLTSVGTTALLLLYRLVGGLQPLELQTFDHLTAIRPDRGQDQRLLIIAANQSEDTPEQKEERSLGEKVSITDLELEQILAKLKAYEPIAVGLDLDRSNLYVGKNRKDYSKLKELKDTLITNTNLFAACKAPAEGAKGEPISSIAPPPEVPRERVGFTDSIQDPPESGSIIRRFLLAFYPPDQTNLKEEERCASQASMSLLLAAHYLQKMHKIGFEVAVASDNSDCSIRFSNGVVFKPLPAFTGGYQGEGYLRSGCQSLLSFQSREIAPIFTVNKFLKQVPSDSLKHRIVLIGPDPNLFNQQDIHKTPIDSVMPGVIVQAHMIRQILDAVEPGQKQQLIWALPLWSECLYVGGWSLVGGFLAWRLQLSRNLGLALAFSLGFLYASGVIIFCIWSAWLPLIPSGIAMLISSAGVAFSNPRLMLSNSRKLLNPTP